MSSAIRSSKPTGAATCSRSGAGSCSNGRRSAPPRRRNSGKATSRRYASKPRCAYRARVSFPSARGRVAQPLAAHLTVAIRLPAPTLARRWGDGVMTMNSRPAGARCLRQAIDAYRTEQQRKLNQQALELLERLANSADAAKAFERLKLKNGREREFLMLCIFVEELARTFPARISTERKMPGRLKRLDEAISNLRLFFNEQMKQPFLLIPKTDSLPMWGLLRIFPDDFDAVNAMMRGLHLIEDLIENRRRVSKTVMSAWRVTRKKHIKNAPNIAAIRLLAEETRRLTGKPHKRELHELAPVILGADLSDESVTYALRAPKKARSRGQKTPERA